MSSNEPSPDAVSGDSRSLMEKRGAAAARCQDLMMGRLAEVIRDCGLSQKEIADAAGYSESYVSLLANEQRRSIAIGAFGTLLDACGYEIANITLRSVPSHD